jgi:hypothetical protein
MKKKQRFYLMIESDKEIEPKEILFALREARPNWGGMSASLAAQQSFVPDVAPVTSAQPDSGLVGGDA